LSTNPDVVRATYDAVIKEKTDRIHQYKDAVAAMIAQAEKKKATLKRITEEVTKLQKLRDGAAAMARKVVERHQGNPEAVKSDPEYLKCQAAYKDFSSTLAEKEAHCQELEVDLTTIEQTVNGHKTQLQSLMRDLDTVKQEKHEAVADLITAREEKEIADMVSGISQDRTSEELQELREIRAEAKASARVSREMSGLDTKRSEEEFLDFATKSAADTEFDALIGLTQQAETPADETADRTRIPES
jgi:chromosome segregation ATPase